MYHEMRWTLEKIQKRLELIQPYVYRRQESLPPFRYLRLDGPSTPPPVGVDLDDSAWEEITPNTYWGIWMTDFALRTTFTVPAGWEKDRPIALHLPLGESGDFSHPEALAYIDGQAWAACDRHHQEILIKPAWVDGKPHALALHGWTGLGGAERGDFFTKLFMHPCSIVQIDPPLRELISLTRVAVDTTRLLKADDPVRTGLLNALNAAFIQLETREPGSDAFYASVPSALETLKEGISRQAPRWMSMCMPAGTPTSTWPGCGHSTRPARRPRAPSPTCCATWSSSRAITTARASHSCTISSARTGRSCSRPSRRR